MLPKYHILLNFIISLILLYFFQPINVLIFFLASFLIDADHYLYYVVEERHLSLKKAYRWFLENRKKFKNLSNSEKQKHKYFILIFHGIEPLTLLLLLSNFFHPIFFVFLGFLVHLIEDLNETIPLRTFKEKISLTYAVYKHFKTQRVN